MGRYIDHLEGWKIRADEQVDDGDRMQENVPIKVDKNGLRKYSGKPLTIALFGLGRIGQIHLNNIIANRRTKLVYCVEPIVERQNYVRTCWHLEDVQFVGLSEVDKVLDDPLVDAVIIGTPTTTHHDLVIQALKAKKGVLCEKPLAHDFDGMLECYKLAKSNNVPLLCAFNRRFDPTIMDCFQRAQSGEIGKLLQIRCSQKDSPFPSVEYLRNSGGIIHDSGVHDIDMMIWQAQEKPIKVTTQAAAITDTVKQIDDFDNVVSLYAFPSGLIGILDMSRTSKFGYDQRLEMFGEEGLLQSTNRRPKGTIVENCSGCHLTNIYYSFASRYFEAYINELKHFVDICQGN